jgi:outer membrane lipoprotein-sorting protein
MNCRQRKRIVTLAFLAVAGTAAAQSTPSAEEIVRRLEDNQTHETSRAFVTMTIEDRFGRRVSEMTSYSRGEDLSLIEFTSRAERGQKILRTEDEIYLFYPDAAELVRLQGAALREGMLGSDVSYEDLTGGKTLLETYDVEYEGTETIDGHACYRVSMEAVRRDVAYPRQTVWVDSELFVARRSEQYSLNGRLLKTISAGEIETIGNTNIATHLVISDALKRNSSTTIEIDEIELGLRLPADLFSLEELSW